jgi:hypothetical protein
VQSSEKRRNDRRPTLLIPKVKPAVKGAEIECQSCRLSSGAIKDQARTNVVMEDKMPGRENFDTQGRHGNIKQNTTNQGYQQDR